MMIPLLFNLPNPLQKKGNNDDKKTEDKVSKSGSNDKKSEISRPITNTPSLLSSSVSRTPLNITINENEPEVLLGFSRIISDPKTLKILQILRRESLTLKEILVRFGIEDEEDYENKKKEVDAFGKSMKQLESLGAIKSEWFSTGEKDVKKYALKTTKGTIKFDLDNLSHALPIELLEDYSRQLIQLVTEKGTVPKEMAIKSLDIENELEFDQVVHYTKKFWSPKIEDFLTASVVKGPEQSLKERRKLIEELREVDLKILETDIDRLIRMVGESKTKSLPVNVLSEALSVSEEQVEAWGKILEKHGIASVKFPSTPVGKVRIEIQK